MGRRKDTDFVKDVKLSAGKITRRGVEYVHIPQEIDDTDPYIARAVIEIRPITEYYLQCGCLVCEFRSEELKMCACVVGRCFMAENNSEFPGKDTRMIIKRDL